MSSPSISPKPLPPIPTPTSPVAKQEKVAKPLTTRDDKMHMVRKGSSGHDVSSFVESQLEQSTEIASDRSLTATPPSDDLTYLFPYPTGSDDDSLSESIDPDTHGELPTPPPTDSDANSLPDYAGGSSSIESSSRSDSNAAFDADEQIQSILRENTPLNAAQMVFEKLKPAAIKALEKGDLEIMYKHSKDKDNLPIYIITLQAREGAGLASKFIALRSKPTVLNHTKLDELYHQFVNKKTNQDAQKQNLISDDPYLRYSKLKDPFENKPKY